MEDAHAICAPLASSTAADARDTFDGRPSLFAVFDGHGGSLVANYAAANVERCLVDSPTFRECEASSFQDPGRLGAALAEALVALDLELKAHPRLRKTKDQKKAEDDSGETRRRDGPTGALRPVSLREAREWCSLEESGPCSPW